MNITKTLTTLGALGLGLALSACSSGDVHLTPGPNQTPIPPASTAQPTGTFVQIERLSRPAIKEVFEKFVDHQTSNASEPASDALIASSIKGTEDALRPPSTSAGTDYGATLASVLAPDEYKVDLSQTVGGFLGADLPGKVPGPFGGRNPNDDVVAVELGVLFGNTLSKLGIVADDGEENNCLSAQNISIAPSQKSTGTFPYLPAPH